MGLVKTRRLAAMQKQQKAKLKLPKPKPDKRRADELFRPKRLAALMDINGVVR